MARQEADSKITQIIDRVIHLIFVYRFIGSILFWMPYQQVDRPDRGYLAYKCPKPQNGYNLTIAVILYELYIM